MILAIDPGLRHCGLAVFNPLGGELVFATLVRNPELKLRGPRAWLEMAEAVELVLKMAGFKASTLVLEVPQVYFGRSVGSDLIELAGVDGAICYAVNPDEVFGYLPREWKGQVPKEIHNERVLKSLSPGERALLPKLPKSLAHNVTDAVGLGRFHID